MYRFFLYVTFISWKNKTIDMCNPNHFRYTHSLLFNLLFYSIIANWENMMGLSWITFSAKILQLPVIILIILIILILFF